MPRIFSLAAMVMVVGVLSLLTLRQAASHFGLDYWYMLKWGCDLQQDPVNLMFTHYATAANVTWELDYHGYWPVTDDGQEHVLDHGDCRGQTQQRLTDWFLEGGTEKKYHVRLWEGLDCEPAWGGMYTVSAAHIDFNQTCGVWPFEFTVHFSDEYNRARDLVLVQLGLPPHAHQANKIPRGNMDPVVQGYPGCSHTAPGSDGYVWYINLYPGTCGDANSDGNLDGVDALFILQYAVGLRAGDNACVPGSGVICLPHSDANQDGEVDVIDALFVLQAAVGLRDLCVCPAP
jgi:hypothetical protein